MSDKQQNLETKLWAVADVLRGTMDANEFKNYILGFIFYKYLSEKIELRLTNELKQDGLDFEQAYAIDKFKEDLRQEAIENLGYFIEPQDLFSNLVKQASVGDEDLIQNVERAFKKVGDSSIGGESALGYREERVTSRSVMSVRSWIYPEASGLETHRNEWYTCLIFITKLYGQEDRIYEW